MSASQDESRRERDYRFFVDLLCRLPADLELNALFVKKMKSLSSRSESSLEHDMRAYRIAAEVVLRKEAVGESTQSVPVCDKAQMRSELERLKTLMQANGTQFITPMWAHRRTQDATSGPSAAAAAPGSLAPAASASAPATTPSASLPRRSRKRKATNHDDDDADADADDKEDDVLEDPSFRGPKYPRSKRRRVALIQTRAQKRLAAAVEEEEDEEAEPLIKVENEDDD